MAAATSCRIIVKTEALVVGSIPGWFEDAVDAPEYVDGFLVGGGEPPNKTLHAVMGHCVSIS